MMKKVLEEDLIVWIDCEMTGLDLAKDHIVEIACIVTDKNLKILDEAPDIVINYPEEIITSMNEWSWEHHTQSGLVDAIRQSKTSLEEADTIISEFIGKHFPNKCSAILAGNSVHVDKKFLEKDFPKTYEYFHYRIIDVSTIKEITRRWYPEVFAKLPTFQNLHRALDDIKGSINELNYYREMVFKQKLNPLTGEFVPNKKIPNNNQNHKPYNSNNNNKYTSYRKNNTTYYVNNNNNNNYNNNNNPNNNKNNNFYYKNNNNSNGNNDPNKNINNGFYGGNNFYYNARPMNPNNPYYNNNNKGYHPKYMNGGNPYYNNMNNGPMNGNNNNNNFYPKKHYNRPPRQNKPYNGPNQNSNPNASNTPSTTQSTPAPNTTTTTTVSTTTTTTTINATTEPVVTENAAPEVTTTSATN